ncbi:hypothetical protein [Moorena sp. SIO4G3]|uniref:hypothetical protein n=1 Tax=Moorena sp. SIO4G3 TaxID=2607821 RepID=UPI00142A7EFC|nr:hypothetical protein [Moorena sp. SIO4G3]NEO78186.1 hypothetical protein [Moorena sp. SIO4G3]
MKNIQRPNYFTSQFLVEEDFKDEQAYHRDMRLRHNRLLHEWGVVEGLEVTRAGDKKIAVSKGMAIDKDGQEIIVLPNCTVPDTINTINLDGLPLKTTIEITVMYREIKDKGYRVGSEIKYTRTTERPKFVIYGSNTSQDNLQDGNVDLKNADSDPRDDKEILLARVTLDNNGKVSAVDNSVRKLAGAKLSTADAFRVRYDYNFFGANQDALVIEQRDLNHPNPDGGIAFVNTGDDGVVETALVIKGNSNVGIGTNNPSEKLEVAGTVKATNLNLTGDSTIDGSLTVAGNLEVQGDVIARDTEHMPGNVSLGNGDNDQVIIAGVIRSEHSSGALRVDDALHTTGALTVDGNVGIGTTSIHNPQDWNKVLDILGSQHARLNVRSGGGVVTSVFSHDSWNGARGVIGTESNHPLTFATNYQHRMTIDPNGNVGIGTTNPQSLLQVGDGLGGGNRPWMTTGLQVAWDTDHLFLGLKDQGADRKDSVLAWGDNTNDVFRFIFAAEGGAADGQEIMRLQPNGNVGIGTNNPSEKLEVAGTVKATKFQGAGNSTIDGSLTVNGLLEVKGNVSLGDADNDEVTIAGVIRSGHSSGALRVDDALHTTGPLTVDGNLSVRDAIATAQLSVTDRVTGSLTIENNLTVGGVLASTLEVSGALKLATTGTQIFHSTNESGTPTGDGFRLRYDNNFFGTSQDALVIEKTDGNDPNPDGGIAFVNTGNDGVEETALVIKGNGNVGIGTTNPSEKLEVAGTVKATRFEGDDSAFGSLTVDGNVGIGTTSIHNPQGWHKVLDILGSQHARLNVRSGGGVVTSVFSHDDWNGARGVIGTESNHPLTFATNYQHRMTIDPNGNVGIGTTNPQSLLQVGVGGISAPRPWMTRGLQVAWDTDHLFLGLKDQGADRKDSVLAWGDNTNDAFRFIFAASGGAADGQEIMRLQPNGNVGIGTNNPSEKLEVAGTVKATKFEGAGDSTIDGSLTVNGLLEVKGNVSLGDADNDEVKVTGVIRSGHSSGALRVDDALHTTGALTVDGNVGIGTTNPSEKLEVAGTVKATNFEGDGSALTGISAGKWSDGGSNKIYYNAGNVGIGTNNPIEKLEVDGAVKAKSLTIEDNLTVNGKITTSGMIRGSSMPPNLIRNSYMNILDGNKPAGYRIDGNVTLEAAHPFTKGFEGPYVGEKPPNAADSVDDATEENPYWFGIFNKGARIKRGGLADGWASFPDGKILKITGDNSGQHTMILFPFESRGNFLTKKYVHLKAWLKISSGKQVGFGELAGWGNGKPNSGLIITKEQSDNAPDGWYRVDGVIPTSEVTKLGGQSFSMGIVGDEADGSFEVYLALPYLANLDNDSWLPSVSDMLSRDGLTVHPTSGNVGIGTTDPSTKLEVDGTVQATRFEGDGSGLTGISAGGTKWSDGSSNKIYYNAGNVGIGTNNPSEKLEVAGTVKATNFEGDGSALTGISAGKWSDGSSNKIYYNAGNVGIGTTNPQSLLQVGDGLGGGNRPWMTTGLQVAWNSDNVFLGLKDEGADRKDSVLAWGDNTNDVFRFIFAASGGAADGQEIMRLQPNGNVGIGTTNPSQKLEVAGTVKATKFEGDGSVGNAELANNSVTNAKIANDAVNAAKIQNGSVGNAKLADNSVTNQKIADKSVTNAKIADNSISMDKLDAVTRNQLDNASEVQSLQGQITNLQERILVIERQLGIVISDPDPNPDPGSGSGPGPRPGPGSGSGPGPRPGPDIEIREKDSSTDPEQET